MVTFRNKISLLCKQGKVDVEYYSPQAFYTLSGIKFSKPLDHHTGVKDPVLTLMRQQQLRATTTTTQYSQNNKSSYIQAYTEPSF